MFFICKAFTAMTGLRSLQWVVILFLDCRRLSIFKHVKGLLSKAPWQLLSVLSSGANSRSPSHAAKFLRDVGLEQPSILCGI